MSTPHLIQFKLLNYWLFVCRDCCCSKVVGDLAEACPQRHLHSDQLSDKHEINISEFDQK